MRYALFAVVLLLGFSATGCMSDDQFVHVYVDNGRSEPISVFIDDVEVATIGAGEFEQVKARTGERRFEVRCNEQTVYMSTKNVEPSKKFLVMKRYLLNPDQENRYMMYQVEYSSNFYQTVESFGESAEETRRSELSEEELAQEDFETIKKEFRLMPDADWFEVPSGVYVLEDSPEVLQTRDSHEVRYVLSRMEQDDYKFVKATVQSEAPTVDEVDTLFEAVNKSVY